MAKALVCIEVSSDSIRLLVGNLENGKPVVLYVKEVAIPGLISNGKVVDEEALVAALSQFHRIYDPQLKFNIGVSTVFAVLPSIGFDAFQTSKSSFTVSSDEIVSPLDVTNVIGLIKKEATKEGYEIVDIIPTEFILEGGRRYAEPPLGEKSDSLTVEAMVLYLPKAVKLDYLNALVKAGFRVQKSTVSSHCNANLINATPELGGCIILDMGARVTTLTLAGGGRPYGAQSFYQGGDDLTDAIAAQFAVPFEVAEKAKIERGYDSRSHVYRSSLFESEVVNGGKVYQEDVNPIIEQYFQRFGALLTEGLKKLEAFGTDVASLPIVLTGGGSKLYGVKELLQKILPNRQIIAYVPNCVGARNPRYTALLGLLSTASYVGSLEDNHRNMPNVSRAPRQEKKNKKAVIPTEDVL